MNVLEKSKAVLSQEDQQQQQKQEQQEQHQQQQAKQKKRLEKGKELQEKQDEKQKGHAQDKRHKEKQLDILSKLQKDTPPVKATDSDICTGSDSIPNQKKQQKSAKQPTLVQKKQRINNNDKAEPDNTEKVSKQYTNSHKTYTDNNIEIQQRTASEDALAQLKTKSAITKAASHVKKLTEKSKAPPQPQQVQSQAQLHTHPRSLPQPQSHLQGQGLSTNLLPSAALHSNAKIINSSAAALQSRSTTLTPTPASLSTQLNLSKLQDAVKNMAQTIVRSQHQLHQHQEEEQQQPAKKQKQKQKLNPKQRPSQQIQQQKQNPNAKQQQQQQQNQNQNQNRNQQSTNQHSPYIPLTTNARANKKQNVKSVPKAFNTDTTSTFTGQSLPTADTNLEHESNKDKELRDLNHDILVPANPKKSLLYQNFNPQQQQEQQQQQQHVNGKSLALTTNAVPSTIPIMPLSYMESQFTIQTVVMEQQRRIQHLEKALSVAQEQLRLQALEYENIIKSAGAVISNATLASLRLHQQQYQQQPQDSQAYDQSSLAKTAPAQPRSVDQQQHQSQQSQQSQLQNLSHVPRVDQVIQQKQTKNILGVSINPSTTMANVAGLQGILPSLTTDITHGLPAAAAVASSSYFQPVQASAEEGSLIQGKDSYQAANTSGQTKTSRYWTPEEHEKFLQGLKQFGEKGMKAIAEFVGTRSVTQVRTHAQKYFLRLAREKEKGELESVKSGPHTKGSKPKNIRDINAGDEGNDESVEGDALNDDDVAMDPHESRDAPGVEKFSSLVKKHSTDSENDVKSQSSPKRKRLKPTNEIVKGEESGSKSSAPLPMTDQMLDPLKRVSSIDFKMPVLGSCNSLHLLDEKENPAYQSFGNLQLSVSGSANDLKSFNEQGLKRTASVMSLLYGKPTAAQTSRGIGGTSSSLLGSTHDLTSLIQSSSQGNLWQYANLADASMNPAVVDLTSGGAGMPSGGLLRNASGIGLVNMGERTFSFGQLSQFNFDDINDETGKPGTDK